MDRFTGVLRFTPQYGKCDPLLIYCRWELKDIGKPYRVWCNDRLYRSGLNEHNCEIIRVDQTEKEVTNK